MINLDYSKVNTPINVNILEKYLDGYDQAKKTYILNGFREGFFLEYNGPRRAQSCPNLKSALENPSCVQSKLEHEIMSGRIKGPYCTAPFVNLKLSPLGLVPKKTSGQFRLIHHLSYPKDGQTSVNSGIPPENTSVHYAGIQEAIRCVKLCGIGSFIAKTDVQSAFRIIPIHPSDHSLLGFRWNEQYYFDTCLPMGCAASCKIFEAFSSALEWIAINKLHCGHMVHILDDFLFVGLSEGIVHQNLLSFLQMCSYMGVPIAEDKTFYPDQIMTFVGIQINTIDSTASLPLDKINRTHSLLETYLQRSKCTLRELHSLIGLLNFACSVISPGRPFLRRLINLTIGIRHPSHRIRLNRQVKADINLWLHFIRNCNGITLFINETFLSSDTLKLYTDAAASLGFGAVYKNKWCYGKFPTFLNSYNIRILPNFVGTGIMGFSLV
ncbi:hypothetical protein SNE40_016187 [Patella caerulea]|uniref:Reverse transcriptase domain-containing protein n=1 Tax=Patella caerulea TaxID=87958 RepID=A0AAN8PIG0_PATCE